MDDYPEHDKLLALNGANQIVGDFIEWLGENGYFICETTETKYPFEPSLVPSFKSRDKLIAEFFEIDDAELSREKDRMVERMRASG